MKILRASASRVQADVVVGANEYGSDVAVQITLDRRDPEVTEALEPLAQLLRQRAFHHLNEAIEERVVRQRVIEGVAKEREVIKRTAKANAEAGVEARIREMQREVSAIRAQYDVQRRRADVLQAELQDLQERDQIQYENERLRQSPETSIEEENV